MLFGSKIAAAVILMLLLTGCDPRLNEFCKQIEEIGYEALLRKFSDTELRHLKISRKRALLGLRRAYDTHCTNTPD